MSPGPPYRITTVILSRVAEIAEAVGRAEAAGLSEDLRLRRINRIRTIQGSLAIEGNILTEEQISTILDGKPVVAPLRDVQEARNATKAYERYERWDPASEADLLNAHEILMAGLVDAPGRYRPGRAAVMGPDGIQHVGPPAARVRSLMAELLAWLRDTDDHPLIASSVFHYEFEFIHPFEDGNGRMGRLWQTLVVTGWKALFAHVPVESLVRARQSEYYQAIRQSSAEGEGTPFIAFMLDTILAALRTPQDAPHATPQVRRLLSVLAGEMSRREILHALGLSDRKWLRERYLLPALQDGFVEMTRPDVPSARNQRYRLTARARRLRSTL